MRTTPFKYITKAVDDRVAECQRLVAAKYGEEHVPQVSNIKYSIDTDNYLASCKLEFDIDADDYCPDSSTDEERWDYYLSYGKYLLTFNTFLLNDLKLPYVHDVVGHEYAHACVKHIVCFREMFFDYPKFRAMKKPFPHGPEFKKFCRLFKVSRPYQNAKVTAGANNRKWNYVKGRTAKMWCCCDEHYVTPKDKRFYLKNIIKCPHCDEPFLPYGMEVHPLQNSDLEN